MSCSGNLGRVILQKVGIAGGGAAPPCSRFSQRDRVTFLLFTCLAAMDMKILGGFHLFSKVMDKWGWTICFHPSATEM